MVEKSAQPQDKYVLRLPDGMRERLKRLAETNGRSMNAEIVDRLDRSFGSPVQLSLPEAQVARIKSAAVFQQMAFNAELTAYAIDLADRMLPNAQEALKHLIQTFQVVMSSPLNLSDEDEQYMWRKFHALVAELPIEIDEPE